MAVQPRSLGGDETSFPSKLRFNPRRTKVIKLSDPGSVDVELPVGTPFVESGTAGVYDVWSDGASTPIVAFLWPDARTQDKDGETLVNAMIAGDVHHDDVPLPAGQTQATLTAALKAEDLSIRDIRVYGVAAVSL